MEQRRPGDWRQRIHIGTSGWSYAHWRPVFYPADLPDDDRLAYYAGRFGTVEVNSSFYRLPDQNTLRRWYQAVPEGFRFSLKASRFITHLKKLKDPLDSVPQFLERVEILGSKLGPILFQIPPRWRIDRDRLAGFLDVLDSGYQYAFEFRDTSWQTHSVYDLLAEHQAALCIFDLNGQVSPLTTTSELVYLRLHGPDTAYHGSYTAEVLTNWSDSIVAWAKQGKSVYCYFDNDEAGYAVDNAWQLRTLLDAV